MKKLLFVFISALLFVSCSNDNELKEKELQLKERELQVRENELMQKAKESSKVDKQEPRKKRKLRYVYAGNAGMYGYFSDGSVVVGGRWELSSNTVKSLYNESPSGTYRVLSDGSIVRNIHGQESSEMPYFEGTYDTWVMTDYHWNVDVKDYDR